jgi:hypothetical protein
MEKSGEQALPAMERACAAVEHDFCSQPHSRAFRSGPLAVCPSTSPAENCRESLPYAYVRRGFVQSRQGSRESPGVENLGQRAAYAWELRNFRS